jgi:hypothetical protein
MAVGSGPGRSPDGGRRRALAVESSPLRLRAHLHDGHRRDPLRLPDRDDDTVALHRFEHFEAALGLIRLDHEH